jgi:hypothetical protein
MLKQFVVLAALAVMMTTGLAACKLDLRTMPNTDTSTTP